MKRLKDVSSEVAAAAAKPTPAKSPKVAKLPKTPKSSKAAKANTAVAASTPPPKYVHDTLPPRAEMAEIRPISGQVQTAPMNWKPLLKPKDKPDTEDFYCVCGLNPPEYDGILYGCEGGCDGWYHATCVGLPNRVAPDDQEWFCPDCLEEKKMGDVIDHPLNKVGQSECKKILTEFKKLTVLKRKVKDWLWKAPLEMAGYTGYPNGFIPEPMDLKTVADRLEDDKWYPRHQKCVGYCAGGEGAAGGRARGWARRRGRGTTCTR